MKLSVIIPDLNGERYLKDLLPSLVSQQKELNEIGIDLEVVIIDNGKSLDDFLMDYKDLNITRLETENPLSFSASNNLGAGVATGESLLFLNNDTVVQPKAFVEMLGHLALLGDIKIVGANLLFARTDIIHIFFRRQVSHKVLIKGKTQHAGIEFLPWPDGRPAEVGYLDNPDRYPSRYVDAVTGACLMITKEEFDKVGGFDEKFVNGWEDTDLCLRVLETGSKIYYCNEAKVMHHCYGSSVCGRFENEDSNFEYWADKWLKTKRIWKILPTL